MKNTIGSIVLAVLSLAFASSARPTSSNAARVVDVRSSDGTVLKGTYFAAKKPGPGVLLFRQYKKYTQLVGRCCYLNLRRWNQYAYS